MYCLRCDYDLRGLPKNRCPECGSAFDPADHTSFRIKPGHERAWPTWLAVGALGHPITTLLLIHATWLAARLALGDWPTPSRDDLTSINPFVSGMYHASVAALLGFGFSALVYPVYLSMSIFAWRRRDVRAGVPLLIAASAFAWFAVLAYFRLDPWDVLSWFFD